MIKNWKLEDPILLINCFNHQNQKSKSCSTMHLKILTFSKNNKIKAKSLVDNWINSQIDGKLKNPAKAPKKKKKPEETRM